MKASELMIGNAVQYNGHLFGITDISSAWPRVNDRYNNKPLVTIFDGGIFTVGLDEISPIPITEEFLEKNGFKVDEVITQLCDEKYYEKEINECDITIHQGSNTIGIEWSIHIDNDACCTIAAADIQYVHQLQNLLNIMNIKFDIEL